MKIIEFKCPACGADLKADTSREVMYCEYCGKKLILDDEALRVRLSFDNAKEAGYGFERGRMNAHVDIARTEAEKLQRMIDALSECESLETSYSELELQNQEAEKRSASMMTQPLWILLGTVLAIIVCAMVPDLLVIPVLLAAGGAIGLIAYLLFQKNMQIQTEIEDTREQMDNVKEEINTVLTESGLESIPEKYRTTECLDHLHNALRSQTAFTISQAVHNYELEQRQLELTEQNKRQLEIQEQQLKEIKALREKLELVSRPLG